MVSMHIQILKDETMLYWWRAYTLWDVVAEIVCISSNLEWLFSDQHNVRLLDVSIKF